MNGSEERLNRMTSVSECLGMVIANAQQSIHREADDYIADDVLYCGKCHTPKQTVIVLRERKIKVSCLCQCMSEAFERKQAGERQKRETAAMNRLKTNGIQDKNIRNWTFDKDDGKNPKVADLAKKYAQRWEKAYRENIGLLLYGGVGTGKTFFAACIANSLLDRGIPALMTNMPKIINALSGMYGSEKNEYIHSLNRYKLLVIDDLGVERQSEYATEQVYNVIDARYRNHQPLIVTTNIPYTQIENPENIQLKRIYDRLTEMCVPIKITGDSRRTMKHSDKMEAARRLFAE